MDQTCDGERGAAGQLGRGRHNQDSRGSGCLRPDSGNLGPEGSGWSRLLRRTAAGRGRRTRASLLPVTQSATQELRCRAIPAARLDSWCVCFAALGSESSEEWPKTFLLPRCALTICHQDASVTKASEACRVSLCSSSLHKFSDSFSPHYNDMPRVGRDGGW